MTSLRWARGAVAALAVALVAAGCAQGGQRIDQAPEAAEAADALGSGTSPEATTSRPVVETPRRTLASETGINEAGEPKVDAPAEPGPDDPSEPGPDTTADPSPDTATQPEPDGVTQPDTTTDGDGVIDVVWTTPSAPSAREDPEPRGYIADAVGVNEAGASLVAYMGLPIVTTRSTPWNCRSR